MITFVLSLFALVIGYMVYGKFIEKVFGPDDRPTQPCLRPMVWTSLSFPDGRSL